MWTTEHSVETTAKPEAIWGLWADVAGWGAWNADIAAVELDGEFAVGGTITMTPRDDDPVVLRLVEVVEGEHFVDETVFGGALIRTDHRIERLADARTRVVYRMEISGASADTVGPEIGPAITADFPETIAALVAAAG